MTTPLRRILLCLALFLPLLTGVAVAQETSDNGLVTGPGGSSVDETVALLVSNLEAKGVTVMAVVNHSTNAASVDLDLRPTQLVIAGNPNAGTPLMNNSRSVGIDLPQKYLVWEDASGNVSLTYNGVPYLVERHGLTGPAEVLQAVTGALANFANSVAPADDSEQVGGTVPPDPAADGEQMGGTVPPDTLPVTGGSTDAPSLWMGLFVLLAGGLLVLGSRGRRGLRFWLLGAAILISAAGFGQATFVQAQADSGVIRSASPYSVDETVTRLQSEIEARGSRVMATVNHAANAASVDKTLPPTQVILFGNPNAGTPLMQSNQTIGIDLPQKMLVWEDSGGSVFVDYNDPAYLGRRHNITDKDQVLTNIAGALQGIVAAATSE